MIEEYTIVKIYTYRLATFIMSAEHKRHRHIGTIIIMTCDIIQ